MADLKGKTAIITGGARGIGRAIAAKLGRAGANLALFDVIDSTGDDITGPLAAETGAQVAYFRVDVTKLESVEEAMKSVQEKFGAIDILVNNAGIARDNLVLRMTEEEWDAVLTVNLKGAFLCSKAVSRYMTKQRSGKIVNIASVIGIVGNAGQANYAASKGGLIAMTKAMAKEFAPRNLNINAVAPGYIETKMTENLPEKAKEKLMYFITLQRLGKPEDVANAVAFLAGPDADYITGQVLNVDGGMVM